MPVISHKLKLVYYDVPKVACTSLKLLFWELENGKPFRQVSPWARLMRRRRARRLGLIRTNIQETPGYQTQSYAIAAPVPEGYQSMVLLRDPIARLHSAWKNKVCRAVFTARSELHDLENEQLSSDPDFGTFIDCFEHYRAVSRPARVHTHPYAWHLGPDVSRFDHVFKLEEMSQLVAFLSQRNNAPVQLPHENATPVNERNDQLTAAQADKLLQITAADYKWLGGMYDPQEAMGRFR